jgi:hypothetical protein
MQSAAILEKEVSDLRAENEKKKRKNSRSTRQILSKEGLTVSEASTLAMQAEQASLVPIPRQVEPASVPLQPRTRAPNKCSICGIQGHRMTVCPNRPRS